MLRPAQAWALALAPPLLLAGPARAFAPAQAAAAPATAPDDDQVRQAARAAVRQARAAARAGDWGAALAAYERALALRPSPKLHYNIAICHQSLMLQAPADSPARERHRRAAVPAYNDYLRGAPDAPDRAQIEQIVIDLGGTPATPDQGRELSLFDPDAPPPALRDYRDLWRSTDTEPAPPAPADPAPATASAPLPRLPRVSLSVALQIGTMHPMDATRSARMNPPLSLGPRIDLHALLGPRRRAFVGFTTALGFGVPFRASRYTLTTLSVGPVAGMRFELGAQRRVALAVGGRLGGLAQFLRRPFLAAPPPTCATTDARALSRRAGGYLSAHVTLSALLGRRRNHAVFARVAPALLVTAPGTFDQGACGDGTTPIDPFTEAGIGPGAGFGLWTSLGYAVRL